MITAPAIPWGEGETLAPAPPTGWPAADVVWPDLSGVLDDYHPARVLAGCSTRRLTARLEDQVGPGSKVAIVVDDPSRWTPVREALPIVLDRLLARGVRPRT